MFVGGRRTSLPVGTVLAVALFLAAAACGPPPDGEAVFDQHCASCHVDPLFPRAPPLDMLRSWHPDLVLETLETGGLMEEQGSALSRAERQAVSEFIAATHP